MQRWVYAVPNASVFDSYKIMKLERCWGVLDFWSGFSCKVACMSVFRYIPLLLILLQLHLIFINYAFGPSLLGSGSRTEERSGKAFGRSQCLYFLVRQWSRWANTVCLISQWVHCPTSINYDILIFTPFDELEEICIWPIWYTSRWELCPQDQLSIQGNWSSQ